MPIPTFNATGGKVSFTHEWISGTTNYDVKSPLYWTDQYGYGNKMGVVRPEFPPPFQHKMRCSQCLLFIKRWTVLTHLNCDKGPAVAVMKKRLNCDEGQTTTVPCSSGWFHSSVSSHLSPHFPMMHRSSGSSVRCWRTTRPTRRCSHPSVRFSDWLRPLALPPVSTVTSTAEGLGEWGSWWTGNRKRC